MKINKSGFTLIELLIAIVIFTIGIMGVFSLILTSIQTSAVAKDKIITSLIADEQIQLVKYIRDKNWIIHNTESDGSIKLKEWNSIEGYSTESTNNILDEGYYLIENNFAADEKDVKITKVNFEEETKEEFLNIDNGLRLYIDDKGRYTHTDINNTPTRYFSILKVEKLKTYDDAEVEIAVTDALKLTSIVISNTRKYTEHKISTIITNWKK